jgi:hypothetical protein
LFGGGWKLVADVILRMTFFGEWKEEEVREKFLEKVLSMGFS